MEKAGDKYRTVKVEHKGQITARAACTICQWSLHDNDASRHASKHVKETGHIVLVEKVMRYRINPDL